MVPQQEHSSAQVHRTCCMQEDDGRKWAISFLPGRADYPQRHPSLRPVFSAVLQIFNIQTCGVHKIGFLTVVIERGAFGDAMQEKPNST